MEMYSIGGKDLSYVVQAKRKTNVAIKFGKNICAEYNVM